MAKTLRSFDKKDALGGGRHTQNKQIFDSALHFPSSVWLSRRRIRERGGKAEVETRTIAGVFRHHVRRIILPRDQMIQN